MSRSHLLISVGKLPSAYKQSAMINKVLQPIFEKERSHKVLNASITSDGRLKSTTETTYHLLEGAVPLEGV